MKAKESKHQALYDFYNTATEDELLYNYNCYLYDYSPVPALIKLIAELRGIDTTNWKEFYR